MLLNRRRFTHYEWLLRPGQVSDSTPPGSAEKKSGWQGGSYNLAGGAEYEMADLLAGVVNKGRYRDTGGFLEIC